MDVIPDLMRDPPKIKELDSRWSLSSRSKGGNDKKTFFEFEYCVLFVSCILYLSLIYAILL